MGSDVPKSHVLMAVKEGQEFIICNHHHKNKEKKNHIRKKGFKKFQAKLSQIGEGMGER